MKKFVLVTCLLMIGFVLVGCGYELTVGQPADQYDTMILDVEIIEISEDFILARSLSDIIHGELMFRHLNLPEIGLFTGSHLTLTALPYILDTLPAQITVIEWSHANIILDVQVIEIADTWVLVRGVETPFLNWNFDFNLTNLPDIDIFVGAYVTLIVRGGDWPMPDPVPLSVISWKLIEPDQVYEYETPEYACLNEEFEDEWHDYQNDEVVFANKELLRELWNYLENESIVPDVRDYTVDYWRESGYISQSFTFNTWTDFAWAVMVANDTLYAPVLFAQEDVDRAYLELRVAYEGLIRITQ